MHELAFARPCKGKAYATFMQAVWPAIDASTGRLSLGNSALLAYELLYISAV